MAKQTLNEMMDSAIALQHAGQMDSAIDVYENILRRSDRNHEMTGSGM